MQQTAGNRQQTRILQIYNVYRLVLALTLLLSFFLGQQTTRVGSYDGEVFLVIGGGYTVFSAMLAMALPLGFRALHFPASLLGLLIADLLALALIVYASGGVISGLALLMFVPVAAGAMLIRGRSATLLPAVASLALIYTEVYLNLSNESSQPQYVQAGLLGALLFATSIYLQYLSERMQSSADLAAQQASDITDLEQLNYLIIQRLRTGIVLLDHDEEVVTSNTAARKLLRTEDEAMTATLGQLPDPIRRRLHRWKKHFQQPGPVKLKQTGPELRLSFAYLNRHSSSNVLVFVEDNTAFIQQAQQMKLASLGRLTASIAHELRNPLAAIGHAAQLLQESDRLADDDRRLADIALSHSQRVNMIIEDILDLSRQQGQRSERFTLQPWLEKFIDNYRRAHEIDGSITLEITPPETQVRFIPEQLTQVLNNLFENGLRYSQASTGEQRLHLSGGIDPASEAPILHIVDEGPGVPAEEQEHLFEPFHTTALEGTGLGLYISRELCEANHARLTYHPSRDGHGCFTIHFRHPERNFS